MKKIIFSIFALSAIWACNKQEIAPSEEIAFTGEKQTIYATAVVSDDADATKLAYSEIQPGGGMGMKSTWEAGDSFKALQDGNTVVTFTLTSGEGTSNGVFSAEATGVTAATQWIAVLGNAAVEQGSGTEIHCSFMNQKGTKATLDDFNYVKADGLGENPSFNFSTGDKLAHVLRVKLPAGIKCIEYTPCAWYKVTSSAVEKKYYNTSDKDGANDYGPSKTSTITLDAESKAGDCIYLAIPCVDYSRTYMTYNSGKQNMNLQNGIVLTIMNDNSDNATKSTGYVYEQNAIEEGGKIQTVDMSGMTLISRPKPADVINIAKAGVVCVAHSSALKQAGDVNTYWAPFNLGASKVSEVGKYIAFGEYYDNGVYDYVTYTLRHKPSGTMYDDIICALRQKLTSKDGNTTFYSMNSSRYDAARVLWGSVWRMPYIIELSVILNADKVVENIDGKDCITFTEGGNSISVPLGGFKKNNEAKDPDYCELWSADMCQRSASNPGWNAGYGIWIKGTLDSQSIDRWDRYAGLNIRPVLVTSTIQ